MQRSVPLSPFTFYLPDFPPLTMLLILTNIVMFVAINILSQLYGIGGMSLTPVGELVGTWHLWAQDHLACHFWGEMKGNGSYHQLITGAFLHKDILHLSVNLLVFWYMAPAVEHRLGFWRFLSLVIMTAIGGNAAFLIFAPEGGVAIGFSGAVTGVTIAFALVMLKTKVPIFILLLPAWLIVALFVSLDILYVFDSNRFGSPTWMSAAMHLGGGIIGLVATLVISPVTRRNLFRVMVLGSSRETPISIDPTAHETIPQPPLSHLHSPLTEEDDRELDRLLAKVSRQGLSSLTPTERAFLDSYSQRKQEENHGERPS